jgi:hypothetical protein
LKPLLSQQVQRGNGTDDAKTLKVWEPAEHQATVDGLMAFQERQRQRRIEAERAAKATSAKVRAIKGKA